MLFWLHLGVGSAVGLVIAFMAGSGILLAIEPALVTAVERRAFTAAASEPGAPRLSVDALLARAQALEPGRAASGVVMGIDPAAPVVVNFGREHARFLHPQTGAELESPARVHAFMHTVEDLHRWLGAREVGRPITGACNLALLFMVLSGLYLWSPRVWRWTTVRLAVRLRPRLQGAERDWNWHTVLGFWCAPLLIVTTLTGATMAYPWATALLYRAAGDTPPPAVARPAGGERGAKPSLPAASLDALLEVAARQAPNWSALNVRFAESADAPVSITIQEPRAWGGSKKASRLQLHAKTAAVLKWEPYAEASRGRQWRSWVRPVHTGEAAGAGGQAIMAASALTALVLVWTGLSMARRRLMARLRLYTGPRMR